MILSAEEEFAYFTLRQAKSETPSPSSLFGIACTRHISSTELTYRPADVTRSSVQKSVVIVVDSPYVFARVREQLSLVTKAWFAQKDFRDIKILEDFQKSLYGISRVKDDERDQYVGLSLREMIHEYKYQTLILFKCALLQPKMLFFGSKCERMCLLQFSLISLIPGLLRKLQDCADPGYNSNENLLVVPTSLRTSERASLLTYMGLPLQIFGQGSFFGPYTPLQQLDMLSDANTTSYIAGSTNSLVLAQKERYCDVLVNLDSHNIDIISPPIKQSLSLSTADRRWIDTLVMSVQDTWDETDPTRPNNHGYTGSEEFIRLQFEEYTLALLSAIKYRKFVATHKDDPKALLSEVYGDPASEWSATWASAWEKTDNYRMFDKFTDSHLFDVIEPRHPCAGASTVEELQRRMAQQVADLHLDERFKNGREVIGAGLVTGQQRVSALGQKIWSDIEVMRENQRRRAEDRKTVTSPAAGEAVEKPAAIPFKLPPAPDLSQAQAQVQAASQRAGAYLSSWGSWAADKRKTGWGRGAGTSVQPVAGSQEQRPQVTTVSELANIPEKATEQK